MRVIPEHQVNSSVRFRPISSVSPNNTWYSNRPQQPTSASHARLRRGPPPRGTIGIREPRHFTMRLLLLLIVAIDPSTTEYPRYRYYLPFTLEREHQAASLAELYHDIKLWVSGR